MSQVIRTPCIIIILYAQRNSVVTELKKHWIMAVEPKARWLHASFRIGRYMYIWGGSGCRTDVVERLNLSTLTYEQRHLNNSSAPDGLRYMAVTSGESHGYTFGGCDDHRKKLNSIYCLDFSTLKCIEIVPATGSDTPTPRVYCGMVHFNRKLVVYGGLTDDDVSSDLLLFDLDNSKYCKTMCDCLLYT